MCILKTATEALHLHLCWCLLSIVVPCPLGGLGFRRMGPRKWVRVQVARNGLISESLQREIIPTATEALHLHLCWCLLSIVVPCPLGGLGFRRMGPRKWVRVQVARNGLISESLQREIIPDTISQFIFVAVCSTGHSCTSSLCPTPLTLTTSLTYHIHTRRCLDATSIHGDPSRSCSFCGVFQS